MKAMGRAIRLGGWAIILMVSILVLPIIWGGAAIEERFK